MARLDGLLAQINNGGAKTERSSTPEVGEEHIKAMKLFMQADSAEKKARALKRFLEACKYDSDSEEEEEEEDM